MLVNILRFNFFFFLIFLVPFFSHSLNSPEPIARPEIKKKLYKDIFDQVKKQNWSMALAVSRDYKNQSLSSYIKWLEVTRPGTNQNFSDLVRFFNNHKHWPKKKELISNIESSISKTDNYKEVINWFKENPPLTSKGSIDYLESLIKSGENFDKYQMIKDIWIQKNLTLSQQRYFIRKYSGFWTQDDNWKRFDRLLYEGKNVSARRTLHRIKGDLRKLGEARLGLSRRSGNVSSLIQDVPNHLINDPGLIYERLRWRRKAKLETASEFLYSPPDEIKNVRNWWINSRVVIRRLINKKEYSKAYRLLNNHNLPLSTQSGTEAEWLAGWVALSLLKNTEASQRHFKNVFENSLDFNVKSKAAFWLALSYEKQRNKNEEKKWLVESAKNKFTFYGQNSAIKLNKFKFDSNETNPVTKKPKNANDLLEVVKIIEEAGEKIKKTIPFLKKLIELSETMEEKKFILDRANNYSDKSIVTKLSRSIEKPSIKYSYPLIKEFIPGKFKNSNTTLALIHAIVHQESNFMIGAYSSAGARGLMQLMPFTAKKVARDLKIKYFRKALTTNPQYNIILGTTYINQMLKNFGNALPLALAAYNAGPSRVKIWLKRYGDPRKNQISYINWVESIPISETRFYVKKVISNLRIYQKKYNINFYEVKLIGTEFVRNTSDIKKKIPITRKNEINNHRFTRRKTETFLNQS